MTVSAAARCVLFGTLLVIICLVGDGPPKMSSPLVVQVMLLPISAVFVVLFCWFLRPELQGRAAEAIRRFGGVQCILWLVYVLECLFAALFVYEAFLFAPFGYNLPRIAASLVFSTALLGLGTAGFRAPRVRAWIALSICLCSYVAAQVLAIFSFPLNYLRSDMLPVIFWADRALLAHQNPYQHFHVAERIYDFPYLPGMLLAFAPAQALHVDLRWAAIVYVLAAMLLIYWATKEEFRLAVAALIGVFVLNPYLQYRHELYTQGHFFSLILVFVLMQRRRYAWSALAFGASMVLSQFSWVIFPFFLMNGLRRGGWKEVGRMALLAAVAAGVLFAPFIASGAGNIAHNAVGQWDDLGRAIARPMNVAYWATFVVRPSQLKWIQLVLLSALFCFCWAKQRCTNLEDTLRWMTAALLVFILFNVLIDGYFYLMLLVPMLVYTCVANGWWREPHRSLPAPFASQTASLPEIR